MKYKVGDRVRIKSLDWYNENKSKSHGTVACGSKYFDYDMRKWCGKIMTILTAYQTCYIMQEDGAKDLWTDEMIEGLVEEEVGLVDMFSSRWVNEFELPYGYIFKDENGNVINATKIVLEKKKKEYPKTFEECVHVLSLGEDGRLYTKGYKASLIQNFQKLLICRDAYWKIAGEEMGLGKPWKPDWDDDEWPDMYYISFDGKHIDKEKGFPCCNMILIFPTEKMRDAFKENFDPDIEICKEFL